MDEAQWLAARCGFLTASVAYNVLDKKKDGEPKAGYRGLMMQIIAERLTHQHADNFVNKAMQWGIEHEEEAAQEYEIETGRCVTGNGKEFYPHQSVAWLGASPDRFVGDDGLLEIKCPATTTHLERVLSREIPLQYQIQMQVQLACTGRKWVDFVDFDPRIDVRRFSNARLLIIRYEPTQEEITQTIEQCKNFLDDVEKEIEKIQKIGTNDGL